MGKLWIPTYSGLALDPLNPDPSQIALDDIARGLSNCCRYAGQIGKFYSVAEHSVRLSMAAKSILAEFPAPKGAHTHTALMHDAAEAYLTDMTTPVKNLEASAPYREIEGRILEVILQRFGIPPVGNHMDAMDKAMVWTEAHYAGLYPYPDNLPAMDASLQRLGLRIFSVQETHSWGWSPTYAKAQFLNMAAGLGIKDPER